MNHSRNIIRHSHGRKLVAALGAGVASLSLSASSAFAQPTGATNRLVLEAEDCVTDADPAAPGHQIEFQLWMRDLTEEVSGYQAFLEFDDGLLAFEYGIYTDEPFGFHIPALIEPLTVEIELSGVGTAKQLPTLADSLLATLVFTVLDECALPGLAFTEPVGPFTSELSVDGMPVTTDLTDSPPVRADGTAPVVTAGTLAAHYPTLAEARIAALDATEATDNCTPEAELLYEAEVGGEPSSATITVRVTDACGNSETAVYQTTYDSTGPDLYVADIYQLQRWGEVGGITAYSLGTRVCNAGDAPADWLVNSPSHPVVAQHMYRYLNGGFEQIGAAWPTHCFYALNDDFCFVDCVGVSGDQLGVHCADAHSSAVNGVQPNMSPRWELNASSGVFPYPWSSYPISYLIGRRLQVHNSDVHPPSNPDAIYFVEAQYVAADETAAGNGLDNCSYRRVRVEWSDVEPPIYDVHFIGGQTTQVRQSALAAWQEIDPLVVIEPVDIPGDGRMMLAYRVSDLGTGWYHYEFALYNMSSHRSAQAVSLPIPDGVLLSDIGFHDVDYHGGEPIDGEDWNWNLTDNVLTWRTTPYSFDPFANAVRWGTTYNFRFNADTPPSVADLTVALFRPGTPSEVAFPALGPVPLTGADCQPNGVDDALDIYAGTSLDCNRTAVPDECEVALGTSDDCNSNGIPDECEPGEDCNDNQIIDICDIFQGTSGDCNDNQIPDECESDADCNGNQVPDICDLADQTSYDCNDNTTPDECEVPPLGAGPDCNTNGVPDNCEADCNRNGVPDDCDIALGTSLDEDEDGIPDECVPTLSEWGMIVLAALLLVAGAVVMRRRVIPIR